MLTGDLVRVRVVKNALVPSLIDAGNRRHLNRAESLIECMQHALEHQRTRGEIEATVRDLTGMDVDHKITKGLAKLLMDKGDFETHAPIEPTALRWQVFCEAAKRGPLSINGGDGEQTTAMDVLQRVAADLGSAPETIARGLYADLKQEQILSAVPLPKPEALLHRYNTSLVQA